MQRWGLLCIAGIMILAFVGSAQQAPGGGPYKLAKTVKVGGAGTLGIPAKANADSGGNANGIPGRRRTVIGA